VVGYIALALAPDWFDSDTACRPGEKSFRDCLDAAKSRSDSRRAATTATLALFAGAISVFGAYVGARTYAVNRDSARRTHDLDREGQITERFTRAIDQLGNANLDIRLGGIYALERIARDSGDDHPQIVEVLTTYVREHAPRRPRKPSITAGSASSETLAALIQAIGALERIANSQQGVSAETPGEYPRDEPETDPPELAADVQAVMRVLGRRDSSQDRVVSRPVRGPGTPPSHGAGSGLNLARTDLRRLTLHDDEGDFEEANLGEANLHLANLGEANLQHAFLLLADLREAHLDGADLRRADLTSADLRGAFLIGADLRESNLDAARLNGVRLYKADLRGTVLDRVDLQDTWYDDDTKWPSAEFDAKARGAARVDDARPGSVTSRD
jgi:hypothetical protein